MTNPKTKAKIYIWYFFPSMIKWKINHRQKLIFPEDLEIISSLNLSILIDLTSMIEGILYDVQTEILEQNLPQNNSFQIKTFNFLNDKISNSTWSNYLEFFEIYGEQKFAEVVGIETYKAINTLFNFRNLLVHGKPIEIHYYEDKNDNYSSPQRKLNNVIKYLKEKNLLVKNSDVYYALSLLNNKVIEHFYEQSITFVKKVFTINNFEAKLKQFEESLAD